MKKLLITVIIAGLIIVFVFIYLRERKQPGAPETPMLSNGAPFSRGPTSPPQVSAPKTPPK